MPLMSDIMTSFANKGLRFVSLNGSTADPEKSTLVYIDKSGNRVNKEINIRLSELEDTIEAIEVIDPEDLADFLLR